MKVSTRIIIGFGILLIVAFIALGYQVSIIYKMQAINHDLSSVNLNAKSTIQLMTSQAADLEDFAKKYFAIRGDVTYENELADVRRDFSAEISQLASKAREKREQDSIAELSKEWNEFWQIMDREKTRIDPEVEGPDMPNSLQDAVDNIRSQLRFTSEAVQASIEDQVNTAAAASTRATTVSLVAGAASLFIAIAVAILLVRAISDPLRQLTHGTRRIAMGQFWHRLPSDGPAEFADLAGDFNTMAQRLSELDEMKKGFVSHVSHELKAPLASMRQVLHLMLQEIAGPLNEQQRKLLRLSYSSAERLSAMVGNLLDVSRMEAGTMEYDIHPYDVVALARGVAEEFEVQANEKQIQLRVESAEEAWAECDRDRILQVIGNLFENALKFAPDGSTITAKVETPAEHRVMVSVSDSGPGVPADHKKKIFEKFHQVKKGKKINGQGVGLGLAICKTIVEAHNGEIWVEDNPSGGSVFSFVLHTTGSPAAPSSNPMSIAGQSR